MDREVKLICSCGCHATVNEEDACGWFKLSEYSPIRAPSDDPKLRSDLYFSELSCLKKWVGRALKILPKLQHTARQLPVRGEISNPEIPELYV